ncbi:MAG: TM2 domain-containing protein [Actinomycetia bacterium]|nr:TM2 domain-containing protein [Actinomycetes bacterium]
MSDYQRDPSWWQASDGKWYPPEQAPPTAAPNLSGGFCSNCAQPMQPQAAICTSCGFARNAADNYCSVCATRTTPGQAVCLNCGSSLIGPAAAGSAQKDRTTAGILAILLGSLGVHKFYLGRTNAGVILLLVTLVSFCCGFFLLFPWLLLAGTGVIGIVEGVIILGKSDAEFQEIYVRQAKEWF